MKGKFLKHILIMSLCFFLQGVFAQEKEVSGVVTSSDDGMPIPAVSVIVKGTNRGVATDFDGKYTIKANEGEILQFISLGFTTVEKKVTGGSNTLIINALMKEEANQLEEVVIMGYGGTREKAKLTNSIATVKTEVLEKGSFSNPAQALSGAVAGLRVAQTSGKPGSVPTLILRGGTNLNGSGSPLVIVDGQVRGGLNDLNPNDIESMEVLKDAGATAIYGARANNGVILVTTKRGKVGSSSMNLRMKHGFDYMNNKYEFLNARDYLYWQRNAVYNTSRIYQLADGTWKGYANANSLNNAGAYGTGNLHFHPRTGELIDPNIYSQAVWSPMLFEGLSDSQKQALLNQGWETMIDPVTGKEIIFSNFDRSSTAFRSFALTRDYTFSMTGGNEKGKYYASLGYFNQEGLPVNNWYKRLNGTLNAEYQLKPWLKSISSFAIAHATWNDNMNGMGDGTYFGRMLSAPPTQKEYVNGKLVLGRDRQDGNPWIYDGKFIRKNNTDKFNLGQSFKVDLFKGLSFTLNGYVMFDEGVYESFDKDYLERPNSINKTRSSSASFDRTLRQTYNGIFNYKVSLGSHNLDAMAGYEYYDNYYRDFSARGEGAPTDDFMDLGLTLNQEGKRHIDSGHSNIRIKSYFGRLNYDYDGKYLLSFTLRTDGYSSLIDNRWGTFPGVSGGWVVTKEDFVSDSFKDILSFAKLRASFGLNGNASGIGAYDLQGSYGTGKYKGQTGFHLGSLPNTGLRWEKSKTFEVGADLMFLENRLSTNITFYDRLTEDKYADIGLPHSSGITGIRTNNGAFRNRGIEFEANFKAINKEKMRWDIGLNMTHNRNIVVKLPSNGLERNRQGAFQVYDGTTGNKIWVGGYQEGQTPGDLYVYEALGIYKNEEEVRQLANNLIDESLGGGGYGSDNKKLYGPAAWEALSNAEKANNRNLPIQPGDVIWKDVNGDGKIDQFDKVKVGNIFPKLTGGINTTFSYENLSISARMDYAIGFKQFINGIGTLPWYMANAQGSFNSVVEVKDSWTPENPNAKYPRYMWADQLGKRNFTRDTSMFVYEGSYLSFREVTLAYSFDSDLCKSLSLTNLEVSLTGQNLGYWTKSKAYSPENLGTSANDYSLPRTVIIGLNLTF